MPRGPLCVFGGNCLNTQKQLKSVKWISEAQRSHCVATTL